MKKWIVLILLMLSQAALVQGQTLKAFTEELPPLNFYDEALGRAGGFSVEIVTELLQRTNMRAAGDGVRIYPWARALKKLEQEKNVMLFSMTKTEKRAPLYKWVGPIADRTVWLWKMRERKDVAVETLDDAREYVIGGVYGFAVSERLKENGFRVDMTAEIAQNWKKLFKRRIDLGTALEFEAAYYMKKFGRRPAELQKLVKVNEKYSFYIALNKETADEIVDRLQQALDRMKSDGAYDAIRDKYLK